MKKNASKKLPHLIYEGNGEVFVFQSNPTLTYRVETLCSNFDGKLILQ
jgi:hypothetical protein